MSLLFKAKEKREIYQIIEPDHYLWNFINPVGCDEFMAALQVARKLTKEEYVAAERRLTDYLKNSAPKNKPLIQDEIIGEDIYLPKHPNDVFFKKCNKMLLTRWPSSTINIHIGSHVEFHDYSYTKILDLIKKASNKGVKTRTILNGCDMDGYALTLALQAPLGLREITTNSSIVIELKPLDPISETQGMKAINTNDKIFEFYSKRSPKLVNLLKQKEQMVSNYFHEKMLEVLRKEMAENGNDISKVDSSKLMEKIPNLSTQDLKNCSRTHLTAQECIDYNLFGKIR